MKISDIYTKIDVSAEKTEPLYNNGKLLYEQCYLHSYIDNIKYNYNGVLEQGLQKTYIPLHLTPDEYFEKDALNILYCSAIDRNIVVFDRQAKHNSFGLRHLSLMKTVFGDNTDNCSRIEYLIYNEGVCDEVVAYLENKEYPKLIQTDIPLDVNRIKNPPQNWGNVILAVSNPNHTLISPFAGDRKGLAALDNRNILLGAY